MLLLSNVSMIDATPFRSNLRALWAALISFWRNLVGSIAFGSFLSWIYWSKTKLFFAKFIFFLTATFFLKFLLLILMAFFSSHIVIAIQSGHVLVLALLFFKRLSHICLQLVDIAMPCLLLTITTRRSSFDGVSGCAAFDFFELLWFSDEDWVEELLRSHGLIDVWF